MPLITMHSIPPFLPSKPAAHAQRGAALLVALIFLVVLTIIGVGVVGTTTTEEKLARNFRDSDIAFAAAEATLLDAEIRITGDFKPFGNQLETYRNEFWLEFDKQDDCTNNGLCKSLPKTKQPVYEHFSLSGTPSAEIGTVTNSPQIPQVAAQPRYLIELTDEIVSLGESLTDPPKYVYRITAVGYGRLSAQSMLQETFVPYP